jgi:ATP sulfurylase/adenylyl-sulfate kinase
MSGGFVVWLTGLSGAGKSTIARALETELAARGRHAEVLDGDEVRTHLSNGLGYSRQDRDTNVRRIGYVARLLVRSGGVAITAAISPYRAVRDEIRAATPGFVEVYVRCGLEELIRRDVKGLYRRALAGEIANFTGVSDPYEEPLVPEIVVDSERERPWQSVARIMQALERFGHLSPTPRESILTGSSLEEGLAQASRLPRLAIDDREASDAYMLASGAFAPLRGFIGAADYRSILLAGRLATGQPFPIPVVLRADGPHARLAQERTRLTLTAGERPVAMLAVDEVFRLDPQREAGAVFGTTDPAHPGARIVLQGGTWGIGGTVTLLGRPPSPFPGYDLTPGEVRAARANRGWKTMVGFQTRNPVHRAHEYLQKVALETVDGLLLHPIVGETKGDDLPAEVRMGCYEQLLAGYFPKDRVLLAVNPAWMRYAGPREAVFHAIVRRNYGCTHFIVGRDHAGVGSYYDTYAAHRIFEEFRPEELGITILTFENAFRCRACDGMASDRTCPHPPEFRESLSGTRVRELLRSGEPLPVTFTRPEVARVLADSTPVAGATRG